MSRGSKRINIVSFIINMRAPSSHTFEWNFQWHSFAKKLLSFCLFIQSVSLNLWQLTHQTEPKASGGGKLILYFFVLVEANTSTHASSNCRQRPTDWQLSLCETNTPAWPSFKRNAWVEVCLHVWCLCVYTFLSFPMFQCSLLFHPSIFLFFQGIWSCGPSDMREVMVHSSHPGCRALNWSPSHCMEQKNSKTKLSPTGLDYTYTSVSVAMQEVPVA